MGQIARVFKSGNSQAVRLPKEFRLDVDQVEISREGDALVLRPVAAPAEKWAKLKAALARGFSDDFMADGREQPEDQDREGLEESFK
jgi:antitoxin VapB